MACATLNQLCSNTKIVSLITYSFLTTVCSHQGTSLGTKTAREMTYEQDSTQTAASPNILLWMLKLTLVWTWDGHIQEAESQEEEYWGEKRVRTISSSKADTSGTRWSMSADGSLAVAAFLSHKGVLKERCKIERVMKTSTAPFFGLKQTGKAPYLWDIGRHTYQTRYRSLGCVASRDDGHICNSFICKPQWWQEATESREASPDCTRVSGPHALCWQPCPPSGHWLDITFSCWHAKRVCYQEGTTQRGRTSPTVKTKQTPNANHVCFPSGFLRGKTKHLSYAKLLAGRGIILPIDSVLVASITFPRSNIIALQRYSKQARWAAFVS